MRVLCCYQHLLESGARDGWVIIHVPSVASQRGQETKVRSPHLAHDHGSRATTSQTFSQTVANFGQRMEHVVLWDAAGSLAAQAVWVLCGARHPSLECHQHHALLHAYPSWRVLHTTRLLCSGLNLNRIKWNFQISVVTLQSGLVDSVWNRSCL